MRRIGPLVLCAADLGLCALVLAGCSSGDSSTVCRIGADCASGVCRDDGTCEPVVEPADAGPDSGLAPDADPALCNPNHDFVVTRGELTFEAGHALTFRVALDAAIDSAGATLPTGKREWAYAGSLTGDHGMLLETLAPDGQWWASAFPDATYALRLSDENDLSGVFQATDDALLLLGVVSPQDGAFRTELAYDPPVRVLELPLGEGDAWSTTSTVTGVASGVATLATEKYESTVDAAGAIDTPFGRFPEVLRVNLKLTRTVGVVQTVSRTHAFVSECYGTVATLRSQDGVSTAEFSEAAEIRRLAP